MGSGMAQRLLAANFPLTVYNRDRAKCIASAANGAFVAASPREAASHAQIILSMVADDVASRQVWLGGDGALAGMSPSSVLIESSTLSLGWIQELATAAAERGCEFLDAPVTGTKPHAASGELLFLVGGSADALDAARPVFSILGRDVIHLGPSGSGALLKLVNNFLCGVQAASFEKRRPIDAWWSERDKAVPDLPTGRARQWNCEEGSRPSSGQRLYPKFWPAVDGQGSRLRHWDWFCQRNSLANRLCRACYFPGRDRRRPWR